MAISWNTGTSVSSGDPAVTTLAVTIPAGVLSGDVLLVAFAAFGAGGQGNETIQVSSTGTAPGAAVGGTQNSPVFSNRILNAAVFPVIAGASDAGKVITGSLVSANTAEWAVALGAWTGANNSAPVDVSGWATASGASSTVTCPSETTGQSGDWDIQIMLAALGGSAYTGGSPFTQRESVADGSSGAAAAIFDSNGSVGGSGANIGGASFANAGHNSWWGALTVGLAPAGGAPHTATGSLTVTPSFSLHKAEAHIQSLQVSPAFAIVKAEAHKQSLTVTPKFAAGQSHTGPSIGGSPDRHHHRTGPWGR